MEEKLRSGQNLKAEGGAGSVRRFSMKRSMWRFSQEVKLAGDGFKKRGCGRVYGKGVKREREKR